MFMKVPHAIMAPTTRSSNWLASSPIPPPKSGASSSTLPWNSCPRSTRPNHTLGTFVHFRIDPAFSPARIRTHVLAGKILRADLASLIEFLSDTLSLKVNEATAGDAVLESDEVSRKFNVSSKTIQRWRKQGLIALRYLYPDGRRRLGFLESARGRVRRRQ